MQTKATRRVRLALGLLTAAVLAPAGTAAADSVRFEKSKYTAPKSQGSVEITLVRPGGGPAGCVIVQDVFPNGDYTKAWGGQHFGPVTDRKVFFADGQTTASVTYYEHGNESETLGMRGYQSSEQPPQPKSCPTALEIGELKRASVTFTSTPACPGDPSCPPQQPTCPGDPSCPPQQPTCPGDPSCPPQQPTCPGDPSCPPQQPTCPGDPSCPPEQQPADTTAPDPGKVVLGHFTMSELSVVLGCSESTSPCTGSLSAVTAIKLPAKLFRGYKAEARRLSLGRTGFSIDPGGSATVTLSFSRKVRRVLARALKTRRSIQVKISLVMADAAGNQATKTTTLALRKRK